MCRVLAFGLSCCWSMTYNEKRIIKMYCVNYLWDNKWFCRSNFLISTFMHLNIPTTRCDLSVLQLIQFFLNCKLFKSVLMYYGSLFFLSDYFIQSRYCINALMHFGINHCTQSSPIIWIVLRLKQLISVII